jgi:hypothetical protein
MNGVNDIIPRSQTAGCSQLLMLENYLPEMRSNACLQEHPNQKTIAGHDNTSVITSPCRFATPRYPLFISFKPIDLHLRHHCWNHFRYHSFQVIHYRQ